MRKTSENNNKMSNVARTDDNRGGKSLTRRMRGDAKRVTIRLAGEKKKKRGRGGGVDSCDRKKKSDDESRTR